MKIKLLLEAADLLNVDNLFKAFERGQISGLSYKKIFEDYKSKYFFKGKKEETAKEEFEVTMKGFFAALISKVKVINRENLKQPILTLILKKLKNNFYNITLRDFSIDPYLTYFLNKDKQEAKTTHKKLFDDFINGEIDSKKDQEFEIKVNKIFVSKASLKDYDKEVEIIYPKDNEGWEVLSPKTFAASSKLACMNNRKSRWCTAANDYMFTRYTKNENKLFIIRNEKKDVMFQMDFGENGGTPNFMDEEDNPVVIDVVDKELPSYILKILKNKNGKSVYDFLNIGEKEKKIIEEWKLKELKNSEFKKILAEYKVNYHPYNYTLIDTIASTLKKNNHFLLYNNKKKYLIIESIFFELKQGREGNKTSIERKVSTILKEKLPLNIKKIILGTNIEEEPKYEKITHEGFDFYILKNKEALYKFLPKDYFEKISSKEKTKNNIKKYLREPIRVLFFRAEYQSKYKKWYFIDLKDPKTYISNSNFSLYKSINNDTPFFKAFSSFLKKKYLFVYNYFNVKDKYQKTPREKLLKQKYIIYNLEGKKIVVFNTEESVFNFISEKKPNLSEIENDKNYYVFKKIMYYENNSLKSIPEKKLGELAKKYSFISEDDISESYYEYKNTMNLLANNFVYAKNYIKKLEQTREEYKQSVLNKVKGNIQ